MSEIKLDDLDGCCGDCRDKEIILRKVTCPECRLPEYGLHSMIAGFHRCAHCAVEKNKCSRCDFPFDSGKFGQGEK
ncbi:MAG: hypothetical protein HY225_01350 [Candidatus Vogelbacteria bacterium]|nr:hypothetical protein [Candidatus Vogelbacteria bacterium]